MSNLPNVIAQFSDPMEALDYLKTTPPDLLFLDIEMPELNGMEILRSMIKPPKVILTTAYSEYALESYNYGVVDYLLKPVQNKELKAAVEKYKVKASEEVRANKIEGLLQIFIDLITVNGYKL